MGVTVGFLYDKCRSLYDIELTAGRQGLDRSVSWIHMIESKEAALFLHGGELVFCTGVLYNGELWLLDYIKNLQKSGAGGLVINVGPYIGRVPKTALDFCEGRGFPLFSIPWKVRLVDVTRYLCRFIIEKEEKERQYLQYFLFILINPDRCRDASLALQHYGFETDGMFRVAVIRCTEEPIEDIAAMAGGGTAEVPMFVYGGALLCILSGADESRKMEGMMQVCRRLWDQGAAVRVGVGSAVSPVSRLAASYKQASAMAALASEMRPVVHYDEMGVYKLLVDGPSQDLLKTFYDDTLGALEAYDGAHDSGLMETLEYYLSHRCSIKDTAAHEVVHRNTVLYKLNKIEKITGKKLSEEDEKLDIVMALKIKKLLSPHSSV